MHIETLAGVGHVRLLQQAIDQATKVAAAKQRIGYLPEERGIYLQLKVGALLERRIEAAFMARQGVNHPTLEEATVLDPATFVGGTVSVANSLVGSTSDVYNVTTGTASRGGYQVGVAPELEIANYIEDQEIPDDWLNELRDLGYVR